MFTSKDHSSPDPKTHKKSRKVSQNRNDPIPSTFPKEPLKNTSPNRTSNQSHSSLHRETVPDQENFCFQLNQLLQEKAAMLDLVSSTEKELDFCNQIISQFIDLNELLKIKQNSTYDERSHCWTLPSFVVQHKKTLFPKLQRNQLKEMLQSEVKPRKVVIKNQIEWKGEEENFRESEGCEGQGRPVTSAAKYRQSSMFNKGCEGFEESRRSPVLRKPKIKF